MAKVYVQKDANGVLDTETAMRRFKKLVRDEGILIECKKREYFMTPNEKAKFKAKYAFKGKKKQPKDA